ncbi:MAG: LysE family translocator [Rhodospirillales bacterium]|nr:LysE family translocator [Rhodospirillales bacterium]
MSWPLPVPAPLLGVYVLVAGALVLSPGPDTLLIIRYTLASGRASGMATVAGVQLGLMVHTAAAVLGLSVLILSSPLLFKTVAVLGAAYLAWLGLQAVRGGALSMEGEAGSQPSAAKALRDAAITNILNPKVILLFLALMPNFVAVELGRVPLQLATLAATLLVINTIWQSGLVLAASWARQGLMRPRVQRGVSWATGAIFLVFAILMLIEHL